MTLALIALSVCSFIWVLAMAVNDLRHHRQQRAEHAEHRREQDPNPMGDMLDEIFPRTDWPAPPKDAA